MTIKNSPDIVVYLYLKKKNHLTGCQQLTLTSQLSSSKKRTVYNKMKYAWVEKPFQTVALAVATFENTKQQSSFIGMMLNDDDDHHRINEL